MSGNWQGFDLRSALNELRNSISKFSGFSPAHVQRAGATDDEALRRLILEALLGGQKTGHEIMIFAAENPKNISATSGRIYPLLENMQDLGLVSASVKKDRKVFSITPTGKDFLSKFDDEPEVEPEVATVSGFGPNWIDLTAEIARSAKRLAMVSYQAANTGSKEQQSRAAAAIDEATRAIHQILSEK